MRLYCFDDHQLGVLSEDGRLADVTGLVGDAAPHDRMTALIERWPSVAGDVAAAALGSATIDLRSTRIVAPQPRPGKIIAAPVNYRLHQQEMGGETGVYQGQVIHTIETYGGIVKASSSVAGPSDEIRLPLTDRRFDHEAELGVVIGRRASHVARSSALGYVFGYMPLLDITLRGDEDRSFRKSFDTFTPIGPAIVTADEVGNPGALDFQLTVNDEVRQSANTRDLIYDVPKLIEYYSSLMTLEAGDILATGTPEGVGQIQSGDEVQLTIDKVGQLNMRVALSPAPSRAVG